MAFAEPDDSISGITVIMCMSFDHRSPVDGIRALKAAIIACPFVKSAMDVSGAFDFIVRIEVENFSVYNFHHDRLAPALNRYVKRYEASFLCGETRRGMESENSYPKSFWVNGDGNIRRIDASSIDKITAERDYMRIHSGSESSLMHSTARRLLEQLDPAIFVRIHRSTIVRKDFIGKVLHSGRSWSVCLTDGTILPISKGYLKRLKDMLVTRSSNGIHHPSQNLTTIEDFATPSEKFARVQA